MSLPLTAEFTIKGVRAAGQKDNPHGGTFDKYYVDLLDPEGKPVRDAQGKTDGAYWQRKTPSEVNAGEVVYGTVSEGDYGLRFKAEKRPDAGGSTGSSGGGSYRSGGGKSPDQEASIHRQVALKILAPTINSEGLSENVKATVLEIETFIKTASGASDETPAGPDASGSASNGGTKPVAAPPQASDEQGVHERIQTLLEASGVNWAVAQSLRSYAMEECLPEKQDEIISALQDDSRREKCIAWLKGEYQKVKGSLPEPKDDGSDIPF